jgi:AhpD family alkylhydroperoxidase
VVEVGAGSALGRHARGELVHLVKLRASQLNGCAYCLDMHWKDLRALGETQQRLYQPDAWETDADPWG